ncbi:MAG: hypothetical protein WAX04_11630 [Oscillospiraceae bacterium]
MLDKVYFSNAHLTPLAFFMLENDGLDLEEKQLILAHISSCEDCMTRYVDSLTEDSLIEPSDGLANRVMDVIHSEQNTMKKTKILVMQFVKLGVALCLTMVIFFSGALGFALGTPTHIQNDRQQTEQQKKPKPVEKDSKHDFFNSITSSLNRGFLGFADQINIGFKGDAKDGAK